METSVSAKFVSQKISKIRWRRQTTQELQTCDTFATGSWDNDKNRVSVWSLGDGVEQGDQRVYVPKGEPVLLSEVEHAGDVTDLQFFNPDHILTTSSCGHAALYRLQNNAQTISKTQEWSGIHHHANRPCPATSLAVQGEEFVTAGEDGRLNVMSAHQKNPVLTIDGADSCTTNSLCFLKQSEVATVNSAGQLKVWDLRTASNKPSKVFFLAGERVPLHCLDKHPSQPHIVATGGQENTLCIWDMRQDKFPVTLLTAHTADMWEVMFHPLHPDNLFTCSEDGTVWHWDSGTVNAGYSIGNMSSSFGAGRGDQNTSYVNPWLAREASKHRLEVTDVIPDNTLPVNSIDIIDNTLLCGTDSEKIYTVRNLTIR